MDAPVSSRTDADINDVSGFYYKIEHDVSFPSALKKKTTVVKYTKLPDFDFENKVCQALKPRLRRIIELDDPQLQTSRSLKLGTVSTSKTTPLTKRKIVSISENEENMTTPCDSIGRITKNTNRSSGTASKDDKSAVQRNTSLSHPAKYSRDPKLSAQTGKTTSNKKDLTASKATIRSKQAFVSNHSIHDNLRCRNAKEKSQVIKSTPYPPKVNLSKNLDIPRESEKTLTSNKNALIVKSINHTAPSKRPDERNRFNRTPQNKNKLDLLLKESPLSKPVTVIHVPIDNCSETNLALEDQALSSDVTILVKNSVDCGTDVDHQFLLKDANVGTSPQPTMVNEETETSYSSTANQITQDVFDNLDIPNVTLIKDKSNFAKDEIVTFCSRSLPNLQAPTFKISPEKENDVASVGLGKSKTYIISRATFTYTTKQKINFHVVGSSDDSQSNQSPSPLGYPLTVVSVLKKKLNHCDISESSEEERLPKKKDKPSICHNNVDQALTSRVNNNNKLVKPSDLISTIRIDNGLLLNDYISEQFQRELHFIDSFFESLQYLESCSLSEKCLSEATSENWVSKTRFDLKNSEYNSFLSKLENGAGALTHVDDIETMASKSLCLLNLLIRDEQRRAKNLLFVLKMREDALKDFTKSQIIWLENKKKQENTDVSTLKKKQRGALLKLQHECGEMQRMRKALLTLSEKRKAALMKTRNNIELKLNNNVNVDQILLGKKKLKRNPAADRNVAPLKCFDLSSSGCEDSTLIKSKWEPIVPQELAPTSSCAEKCVQTGDSLCEPTKVDRMTDTADEYFVAVDGGYLNILFQHLALPQIFSSGKQYEVNEEALRNVVESSNKPHPAVHLDSDVVENFMDKIRNRDSDRSSSHSTAHSLVDEFDQYYKGLSDGSKSSLDSPDIEYHCNMGAPQAQVYEIAEAFVQAMEDKPEQSDKSSEVTKETIASDTVIPVTSSDTLICESLMFESSNQLLESTLKTSDESVSSNQTGPLPVPPGAASPEPVVTDGSDSPTMSSDICSRSDGRDSIISLTSLSPGQNEAEELRRQQLAIEREIKALEQQQNQLLVVREIPDKPPPPYTPPNNASHKTSPMFVMTEEMEENIYRHVTYDEELSCDPDEPFSVFIKDVCGETLARQRLEMSEEPWDACNLLPHEPEVTPEKRGQKTVAEINQILSGVPPTVVSGVGARRSDHIDDILFAEWRRCEPEWTALQADEAAVKTQVFESLFQKVLSETIDKYKQIVLGLASSDGVSEKVPRKNSKTTKFADS